MVKKAEKPGCDMMTDTARLIITEGDGVRCVGLDSRPRWTLGRETPANIPDIPLYSAAAGRTQGQLIRVGGRWFFCDGGSVNGTFYKGKRLGGGRNIHPVMLESGDVLSVGPGGPDAYVWFLFTTGDGCE